MLKGTAEPSREEIMFVAERESGLFTVAGSMDEAGVLSDLKTAFLVAFAVLGYRFAFAPALKPIRAAIQAGIAPPIVVGQSERTADFPKFTVCEVTSGSGEFFVMVVGDRKMWNLPAGENTPSGKPPLESRLRPISWPEIERSGNRKAMQHFQTRGRLFHSDHCDKHRHEEFHGPAQPRKNWPVSAAEASGPARLG